MAGVCECGKHTRNLLHVGCSTHGKGVSTHGLLRGTEGVCD